MPALLSGRYRGIDARRVPLEYLLELSGVRFLADMEGLTWLQHHCRCGCEGPLHRPTCVLRYARPTTHETARAVREALTQGRHDPCVRARHWHHWNFVRAVRRTDVDIARRELRRRVQEHRVEPWGVSPWALSRPFLEALVTDLDHPSREWVLIRLRLQELAD